MSPELRELKLADRFHVVVVMPVFRDWECAALVCNDLDEKLGRLADVDVRILLVDDGGPTGVENWPEDRLNRVGCVEALRLRRNLGHQRAICIGLCHVHDHLTCDAVVVMDSDGEDMPADAVRLIEAANSNPRRVVFAERRKRHEGLVFRTGYFLYRTLHHLLVGIPVRVGNFSVVPFSFLTRLTCMSELWNHFAGAIYKSKVPFESIPIDRGQRLRGKSQMDLASLVAHGIAGIATFQETVSARILITSTITLVLLLLALLVVVAIRLTTNLAIAGWATYTVGFVVVLVTQLCTMAFSLVFTLISNRSATAFVPSRDYTVFVERIDTLQEGR